ncbi:phage tail tape measure protein [Serratia oryzae]|uniref:phage tail tape measure protein n=1 Tax=Serratia oryzae TaxID=2034155 RepID=UPI0012E27643|nr:phage tail tape measure protein [Serratia oryzae]
MSRNLSLALTLTARDTGSKVLRKAMQDAIQQTAAAEKAGDGLAKSQQQNSATGIRASRALSEEYRRASNARSTLGVRSERDIQREIALTQAAYSRLTRSGLMSANEQSRAFTAMTQRIGRLRDELKGAGNEMSRMGRMRGWGSNAMALAGGVTAAAMVIKDPVQRQMAFERRNAEIANTAFNQLPADERIKKIPVINTAIREAVRYGGGTPEAAQDTLSDLFAGGLDEKTSMKLLPDIIRYATASGANPQQLAQIGIAAYKNFGIKLEDLPAVYDKAIRSGENGKYELSDMAGSLAGTLTKANAVGMSGLNDLDTILAMLQANAETAGDNNSASTNVNNLLEKYTSADTQNALKKHKFRNKNGEVFNYTDYMTDQRKQGVSIPAAFTNVVSGIVSSDKRVQHLRAEAEKYKGTDKEKDIKAALDVAIASVTSKIIADQQARMGLITSILKGDFIKEQITGTENALGAGASSFSVMSSTNAFKSQQFESEKLFAEQDAVKPVADFYADLTLKLIDYAKEYPELTTAVAGATIAIKAMTSVAMIFAGIRFLQGGGGINGPKSLPPIGGASKSTGISIPALYVTAGSIAISSTQDYLRENFKNNTMPEKLDSIKAGTSGYSFVDIATEVIKNRWSKPVPKSKTPGISGINISQASYGPIEPLTTLPDAADFGTPEYLKKKSPSINEGNFNIHLTSLVKLDERTIAEAVSEYFGMQASRGPTGGGN